MLIRPAGAGRVRVVAGLLLGAVACARIGPPTGGPDDKIAPKLLATNPESLGVYPAWHHDVEFHFDEVISEGSSPNQGLGTGDLEKLVILSPTDRIPVVDWHRDHISVHPREGWRRDRVYRVELLPGVTDLRRNRSDTSTVLTFSTGGPAPTDTLHGMAVDWVQGKLARGALIELMLLPDSLMYRTLTDSTGRYTIGPLPHGSWAVIGALDQNHNLRRERRESYDSVMGVGSPGAVSPLWLLPRDTVGPRIQGITQRDSVSATVSFTQPLDPAQALPVSAVRLTLLRDSTPVSFRSLLPEAVDDSLEKLRRAPADSVRPDSAKALPDTTKPAPGPAKPGAPRVGPGPKQTRADPEADSLIKTRPRLFDKLVLRVDSGFTAEARYQLELAGIRNAAGVAGDARGTLVIPKPRPPAPAPTPSDSTAAPPGKAAQPDSTAASPPPPPAPAP